MPDLNAIVKLRIDLAPSLRILQVAPDGWELPPFRPGQFAVLGLPASAPRNPGAEPEDPPLPKDSFLRGPPPSPLLPAITSSWSSTWWKSGPEP